MLYKYQFIEEQMLKLFYYFRNYTGRNKTVISTMTTIYYKIVFRVADWFLKKVEVQYCEVALVQYSVLRPNN